MQLKANNSKMTHKMDIKKDIKNDLMGRRELQIVLEAEKTPSFAEISKMIAEKFNADESHLMVENVKGKFGKKTFLIKVAIYNTKELKDESFKRLIKQKKAKPGEAPAEAA